MSDYFTLPQIDEAANAIRKRTSQQPKIALILGSGLGGLADAINQPDIIPYQEIPYWYRSTIEGHAGRLVIGDFEGKPIMVMQGRSHYYEGVSIEQIGFPVRTMQRLGIEILIVTNAAGAINPEFVPGELMLIKDHIALLAMTGLNPLRGANLDELGPRFPDMSQAYDRELMQLAKNVAVEQKIGYREGVYICLAGPSFESPADLRFLRVIGADAVGMSTVPEVIVARHGGTRVLGISGISNKANLDGNTITSHAEVLEAGKVLVPRLTSIVSGVLRALP